MVAENPERLSSTIHGWQERLLQLDRRNTLLYFKGGSTTVPIPTDSVDDLDTRLRQSRTGLTFPFAERLGRIPSSRFAVRPVEEAATPRVRVTPGDLSSSVEPLEPQRRLRAMAKRAQEWGQEQGLSVLYLACGSGRLMSPTSWFGGPTRVRPAATADTTYPLGPPAQTRGAKR